MLFPFSVYVETGILVRSIVCCGQFLRQTIEPIELVLKQFWTLEQLLEQLQGYMLHQ